MRDATHPPVSADCFESHSSQVRSLPLHRCPSSWRAALQSQSEFGLTETVPTRPRRVTTIGHPCFIAAGLSCNARSGHHHRPEFFHATSRPNRSHFHVCASRSGRCDPRYNRSRSTMPGASWIKIEDASTNRAPSEAFSRIRNNPVAHPQENQKPLRSKFGRKRDIN